MKKFNLKKRSLLLFFLILVLRISAQEGVTDCRFVGFEPSFINLPSVSNEEDIEVSMLFEECYQSNVFSTLNLTIDSKPSWVVDSYFNYVSNQPKLIFVYETNNTGSVRNGSIVLRVNGKYHNGATLNIQQESCNIPTPTNPGNIIECEENPIQTLTATATPSLGAYLKWYEVASGGVPIVGSPTWNQIGTKTYYAASIKDNCESEERLPVTLTINSAPLIPVSGGDQFYCEGDYMPALLASVTGANITIDWYDSSLGGNKLGSGSSYLPSSPGIYYAESRNTVTGCVSLSRTAVTLTELSKPSTPTGSSFSVCQGDSVGSLIDTGETQEKGVPGKTSTTSYLLYYTDPNGIGAQTQPTIDTSTPGTISIWVSQFVDGCESDKLAINIDIFAIPSQPQTEIVYSLPCSETAKIRITNPQAGYTYSFNGSAYSSAIESLELPVPGIYTVYAKNTNGCTSSKALVDVELPVQVPITFEYDKSSYCKDEPNPTPTIIGPGGAIISSTPTGLVIDSVSGEINLATSQIGTYTISYSPECYSPISQTIEIKACLGPISKANQPIKIKADCTGLEASGGTQPSDIGVVWYWQTEIDGKIKGLTSSTNFTSSKDYEYVYIRGYRESDDIWGEISDYRLLYGHSSGSTWYKDFDGDKYYSESKIRCSSPGTGWVLSGMMGGGDCDDSNPDIYPGATELCNGIDDNCDGQIDEGCPAPCINPEVPVSAGDQEYCLGSTIPTISATVNTGETIDWYDSASGGTLLLGASTSYTPSVGGTYYAEARNISDGCVSDSRIGITIVENSLPSLSITVGTTCFTENGTYSLTVESSGVVTEQNGYGTITNTEGTSVWEVSNVPVGTNITLQSINSNGCSTTLSVVSPDCSGGGAGGSDYNYIYTIAPQNPMTTIANETDDDSLQRNITYFDGLGRPMQSIGIAQGGNKEDLITHIGYDDYGRQDKDYLPFVEGSGSRAYRLGNIKDLTQQYYKLNFGTDFNDSEDHTYANPFSQKDFEASPLNRVLRQAAPGESWKMNRGNEIEFDYLSNAVDEVRLFEVSLGNDYTPTLVEAINQFYNANELYKTITRDENHSGTTKNHTTEEFKDKQGRVILKRTYGESMVNGILIPSAIHDTYYVYDDFGNLTYVLPPKMEASSSSIVDINNQLNELGYQYQYDYRNRLVEKQLPGKGREYIVYDKLDRPVLTQDSVQRMASKWLFTKYDAFGRVVYTGLYVNSANRTVMQQQVDDKTTVQTGASSSTPTPVTLQNNIGVDLTGSTISRTANGINWTDAYFSTNESIIGDGSIEFTANSIELIKIGLNATNNNTSIYGIDYSMEVVAVNDGTPIRITENWVERIPDDDTYSAGDKLSIERVGTTVYYKKNDVTIYTSTQSSTGELYGNGFIYSSYGVINNLTITNSSTTGEPISENTLFENRTERNDINVTEIYYDNAAFPSVINNIEDLPIPETTFINPNPLNISINGNTITKTGYSGWQNSSFFIKEYLDGDGYLEFQVLDDYDDMHIGFDVEEQITDYTNIDFGVRFRSGNLEVHQNDSRKRSYISLNDGDIVKIERKNGIIHFKVNNKIEYSTLIPVYDVLYVSGIMDDRYTSITNVQLYNPRARESLGLEVLTINYYDDYEFDSYSYNGTTANPVTTRTKGLSTGSKVKVLGTSNNWITTTIYYDEKARPIYTHSVNDYLGTTDIVESTLDFVGNPTKVVTTHQKTRVGQTVPDQIVTEDIFEYDHAGRLLTQTQSINNSNKELIVVNHYDELGQLDQKKVGGVVAPMVENSNGLQKVDYTYNIRGWLKAINNDTDATDNDLFNFKINYNTVTHGGTPLFNGNISETEWMTKSDNATRWYTYNYDALNRIKSGIDNTIDTRYSLTNVEYDKNGNIQLLERKGHINVNSSGVVTNYDIMDDLTYGYEGNQLKRVTDAINTPLDLKGEFKDGNKVGDDYTYDANGNMITDANKGILNINYNHLNLPTQVTFGADKYIDYIYDASGVKLSKVVTDTGNTTKTKYAGNYIYEEAAGAEELKFFNQPEGYVEPEEATDYAQGFNYVYQYKDHLGNIRLSYADADGDGKIDIELADEDGDGLVQENEIVEENNYYPFGLKHKGYNNVVTSTNPALKKMYNGKEFQDELGLDWYDYGARNYDPALGRWMNPDPLAEHYVQLSPYNYTDNNPIFFIDPDGKRIDVSGLYEKDEDGNYIHKELINAFHLFATSKVGIEFLSKFAEKGQVIAGHEYTESGEYHNEKVDLAIGAKNLNIRVTDKSDLGWGDNGKSGFGKKLFAESQRENGERVTINLNLNSKLNSNNDYAMNYLLNKDDPMNRILHILDRTKTFFHEVIIHADSQAKDIIDNNKLDGSNILDMRYKNESSGYRQHKAAKLNGSLFLKKALPSLYRLHKKANTGKTYNQLKKEIIDYND